MMNNSVAALDQKPHIFNPLQASLKSLVAEPHENLESLPAMQRFASGRCNAEEYMVVTRLLQSFWHSRKPAAHNLPKQYRQFLEAYLNACESDVGEVSNVKQVVEVDELAFYYALLALGRGAKGVLKNNFDNSFAKHHLFYLAKHCSQLWQDFSTSHLAFVPCWKEESVKQDTRLLFDSLLRQIKTLTD